MSPSVVGAAAFCGEGGEEGESGDFGGTIDSSSLEKRVMFLVCFENYKVWLRRGLERGLTIGEGWVWFLGRWRECPMTGGGKGMCMKSF